jgi:hypothetical protein
MSKRALEPAVADADHPVAAAKRAKCVERAAGDRGWILGLPDLDLQYIIKPFQLRYRVSRLYILRLVTKWHSQQYGAMSRALWPLDMPVPKLLPHRLKLQKYFHRHGASEFPTVADEYGTLDRWLEFPLPRTAKDVLPVIEFEEKPAQHRRWETKRMIVRWDEPHSRVPILLEETRHGPRHYCIRVQFRAFVGEKRCEVLINPPDSHKYNPAFWMFLVCMDRRWWDLLLPTPVPGGRGPQLQMLLDVIKDAKARIIAPPPAAGPTPML